MDLRLEFENEMQDWIKAHGRPTWDEDVEIYKEKEWHFAWVAYRKAWKKYTRKESE